MKLSMGFRVDAGVAGNDNLGFSRNAVLALEFKISEGAVRKAVCIDNRNSDGSGLNLVVGDKRFSRGLKARILKLVGVIGNGQIESSDAGIFGHGDGHSNTLSCRSADILAGYFDRLGGIFNGAVCEIVNVFLGFGIGFDACCLGGGDGRSLVGARIIIVRLLQAEKASTNAKASIIAIIFSFFPLLFGFRFIIHYFSY